MICTGINALELQLRLPCVPVERGSLALGSGPPWDRAQGLQVGSSPTSRTASFFSWPVSHALCSLGGELAAQGVGKVWVSQAKPIWLFQSCLPLLCDLG
uniref:Uncharacterized protein n=1 Tax=Myotis myotis TaxID=51298 RepID=A0A7J7UN07_MYOMY|nr:hypothetical protein mMyoMyo1_000551 [Myotis myotis]